MRDATLQQLFTPTVTALGYELVGVERVNKIVRVYIDKPQGISISDCERVSHQIEGILEVENSIRGQYTLEVSSPGVDRPLFTVAHYAQFLGCTIKLRLIQPIDTRRSLTGVLQQVTEDCITILTEGVEYKLPYDQIQRAHVVPDF
jgi:ribosome maturation factor RimP